MTRRTPAQYDWDELEFDEQILRKHFTSLGSRDIEYTVAHHMTIPGKGTGSALDACYATWQKRKASAHYGIDGTLVRQFVWDKDYAWATGSTAGNLRGVSLEHANSTLSPTWGISDATLATGAKLTAYIHKAKHLGRPRSNSAGSSGTMRTHSAFFATACPGPFFRTVWDQYVAESLKIYLQITGAKPVDPAPPAKPKPALWGKPETWTVGAVGEDVGELDQRIKVWSDALSLDYAGDSSDTFTEAKRAGISRLQVAWGFGDSAADLAPGGHSDGYPGLQSFNKLEADPVPPVIEPSPEPPPSDDLPFEVPTVDTANWLQRLIEKLQALLGSLPTPEPAPEPTPEPEPVPPSPPVAVWGKPETFVLGATGPDVTRLGERVVIWSKALNLPTPYEVGPGPELGPADVAGVGAIQRAWGWAGADSDGYPGPTTFARLAADPPTKETPVPPKSSAPTRFPKPFDEMYHVPSGAWYAAANSILGLETALAKGYPSIDMDSHVTKDGVWALGHDTTPNDDHFVITPAIAAKYGSRPNIEKMTWADLSTLRTPTTKWDGQYVQFRYHTVTEVMEWLGDHPSLSVSFELKQSKQFEDPATFKALADLADKYGVDRKRIAIMSIARPAYDHLARFKAAHAYFRTAILPHDLKKPSNWSQVEPFVDHYRGSWAK